MSVEDDSVLEFDGKMSSNVIREKMEVLGERRNEDLVEISRLKKILAERKYGKMTLEEAGELWLETDRSGRYAMACEIPEIVEDLDEHEFEYGHNAALEQLESGWDCDDEGMLNISEYFAWYCK